MASALPVVNMARTPGALDISAEVEVGAHHAVPEMKPRGGSILEVEAEIEARNGQLSVVEILTEVTTTITPLCQSLTETVSAENVDVNGVVPIVLDVLGQVLAIVTKAKADITASISSGVAPLILHGEILDLKAVAKLVGGLIVLIVEVLGLVFKVVGGVHKEVLTIISNIGYILGDILALVLHVVGGLLVVLLPIIHPVISTILDLGLNTLAGVLSLIL
ncbi:hypothetical protein Agabi119p4_11086 [Agaricus bisporus var. burnettii]|uniref:Uncharacterized protein n=1 Tax=Agaricus bisporus var. burnettii TaxID=192524 RepID=A0A8H7C1T2_AGABI|nr:hypothetical protein Agabi119p4_11086 [Agaricus bisporus var. burnettii]